MSSAALPGAGGAGAGAQPLAPRAAGAAAAAPPPFSPWPALLLALLSPVLVPCAVLWAAAATLLEGTPLFNAATREGAAAAERAIFALVGVDSRASEVAGMHTVAFAKAAPAAAVAAGAEAEAEAEAVADAEVPAKAPAALHPAIAFASGRRGGGLPPLLLLHGYGSGSALWLHNARALADGYAGPVLALDWRGFAASTREPRFPRGCSREEAESWFVSALEAWRTETRCERLVLVGHSLGGYLCACYAMRHPRRVAGLFLVSPAGIAVPQPLAPAAGGGGGDAHLRTMRGGMVRNDPASPTPRRIPRFLWGIVSYLWEHDWVPGRVIRNLGPFGRRFARSGIRRRASRWVLARPLSEPLLDLVGDYLWHANGACPGSGEFALRCLLRPGAWAREPVGARLVALAECGRLETSVPVVSFYGATHDCECISGAPGPCALAPFGRISLTLTLSLTHSLSLPPLPTEPQG